MAGGDETGLVLLGGRAKAKEEAVESLSMKVEDELLTPDPAKKTLVLFFLSCKYR